MQVLLSSIKKLSLVLLLILLFENTFSQTCIQPSEVRTAWTNIPYFDGDDSRITISELNANSYNSAKHWFQGSFSMDMWIKPTWLNQETHDDVYTFFSAGHWNDDFNSLFIYFEEYSTNQWRIRISDGNQAGSNTDILYNIDYLNQYEFKWKHLAITYDDSTIRLYIDGQLVKSGAFVFNDITDWHCTIGHNDDVGSDFKGDVSGIRIWKGKKLNDSEISFIWDKTFNTEQTMPEDKRYLYNYLVINMYTDVDNLYSLIPNKSMVEMGIVRKTTNFHSGRPVNAYNLNKTEDYHEITLNWESVSQFTSYYIYRKNEGLSGDGELLCITNDTFYVDNDIDLICGLNYVYTLKTYWMNSANPLNENGGLYTNNMPTNITASLKSFDFVQNLRINQDATNGNCSGEVRLLWDEVFLSPSSYGIEMSINNGAWQSLNNNVNNSQYFHLVDNNDLGKNIRYRVDANGDGCLNYSNTVTGVGNKPCADAPTSVVAAVENGDIKVDWAYTAIGAPASAYKILRKVDAGSYDLLVQNVDITLRSFIDQTAEMCKTYSYKVEAYNTCGVATSSSTPGLVIPMQFDNVFTYEQYPGGPENHKFDASKGYFNQKVRLEWEVNQSKKGDIDAFEIYRKLPNEAYGLITTLNNSNVNSYDDMTTEANTMYQYMIRALGDCSGTNHISDSLETTGFRYSTAIVAGKVTYSGGNAVPNVEVRVSTSENISASSLYFSGNGQYAKCDDILDDSLFYRPLSTDCWIKPDLMMSGDRHTLISIAMGTYFVGIKNMKPVVGIFDRWNYCTSQSALLYLEADTVLEASQWNHIASNFNPQTGIIELYLNGSRISSTTYTNPQTPWWSPQVGCSQTESQNFVLLGRSDFMNHHLYSGYIDELRIWQKFRSSDEIKRDYVRILTGNESDLIGYYRFDENFGYAAYDLSKNTTFNKNDFDVTETDQAYFPQWSNETPSFEQLHPSGITDANGNYTIKGIRYSANGNIFSVSPFLGIHNFNPSEINLFIGDASSVHNNINFVDQSSFRFTGTAYYAGTNVPVEDANIYIDNVQQFDAGGHAIQSNNYGQIDISVPIGEHYISIKKDGHTFAYNGQWPSPTADFAYPTFNFQEDVFGITFWDSTIVSLVGRFVGGDREGNKNLDLGLSNANIGKGTIILKNEQGFDINTNASIYDSRIEIQTNSQTGEYRVDLLPIVYKIDSVGNDYYQMNNLDLGLLDLSVIPDENITVSDTSSNGTISQSTYCFERKFLFYSEPTLSMTLPNGNPLIGETNYIVENPSTGLNDTLDLENNSPFRYPIFVLGKTYPIRIAVNSIYFNHDNSEIIADTVPISEAQVQINNNIEIAEPTHQFTTNENGIIDDYIGFRVGLPNMNSDEPNMNSYTKTINVTASAGNFNISWNSGNAFRAYVLGGVDAGGVNYVTYGPELTKFILRDPPGDRSYTMLEQGSSYTASQDFDFGMGSTSVYDNVLMRGVKFEVGGGLAGPVFTSQVQTDLNIGISTTSWVNRSGEFMETFDFNQTFSTSSDPNAVGSMADVYIGKSQNLFFTETQNLRIFPKSYCDTSGFDYLSNIELADSSLAFTIGKKPGFAVTEDPSSTLFIYSQDHILNTLLPTYRQLIYSLFLTPKYTSNLPNTHLFYGMANNSPIWQDSTHLGSEPSYHFNGAQGEVDSVAFLNQQISIWIQTIALNEASKLKGNNDEVENISFDGNAGAYINTIEKNTSQYTHKNYFYRFEAFGGSTSGFSINGTGLVTYSQTYKDFDLNIGSGDTETQTMKWKYILDDSQQGDYYSVDIKQHSLGTFSEGVNSFLNSNNYNAMSTVGWLTNISAVGSFIGQMALSKLVNPLAGQAVGLVNAIGTTAAYMGTMGTYANRVSDRNVTYGLSGASPFFSIQGGQSRCPYEGPEYTAFFIDSLHNTPYTLHAGTQQHEIPKISINPSSVINVPDGSPAVFTLSLTNESSTGEDFTFELMVDQNANPDGAELRIDGISPNRSIFIPAGTTITKTLTVERGPNAQMNYDNLQMILHSSCQFNPDDNFPDIADTVAFSAHFIPVCSQAYFSNVSQNWVVNYNSNNNLPININGYNINQPTFSRIYVQYQQAGLTPTTFMTLFNDTTGYSSYSGPKMLINGEANKWINFNTQSLNDGNYTIFLTSTCSDGSTYESEHFSGVIDRICPRNFGTPQPSDGILSYGEDISVTFNETINSGQLYTLGQYGSNSFISVKGITNGTDLINQPYLLHDANIHFDGENDYLKINNINLNQTDFTIEFWAKRSELGRQCVLSIGNPMSGGFWAGFNQNNNFVVEVDGQSIISSTIYDEIDQWAFYSITYDREELISNNKIGLFILNDAGGIPQIQNMPIYSGLDGVLYVGYCPDDQTAFSGNMHELRIWNYSRLSTEISSQKAQILNGYEQGLYGYWPMTEIENNYTPDKAFGRNALVNATFNVSRNGKACAFNGTNKVLIPTSSMAFNDNTDFTIEFWYKTPTPGSTVTLLSNGYFPNDGNVMAWSINANELGQFIIENENQQLIVSGSNFFDNNWHHFAMSVNRLSNINVYIDGNLAKTTSSYPWNGLGAANIALGCRWYNLSMIDYYDQYFSGIIDELRIWNSTRNIELIKQYKNHSLMGNESGLKAYFPFEDVTIQDPSISNESNINFSQDTIAVAGDPILDPQWFTSESPYIKLQRPEVLIPHILTINNDRVIITPDIDAELIENQTLSISIKKVKDLNNNEMLSALTWNAFIDKNQVVWELSELQIEKMLEEEKTVSVSIKNKGGNNETFQILNVPSWMTVSPLSGTLNPLETETIEITINPELNIGEYQIDLTLSSSMGYLERLALNIHVKGNEPDWTVNPDNFQYSANLIAQIKINQILSTDVHDKVAAFIDNECRGTAYLQYHSIGDVYLLFMDIYHNSSSGGNITFKVYDASTGEIYTEVLPELVFQSNQLFGSISNPVIIEATNNVEQILSVNQGWNWISFNVYNQNFQNVNLALSDVQAQSGNVIKSMKKYAQFSNSNRWSGNLNALTNIEMYKLKVSNNHTFTISGQKVLSDTIHIPISTGWNWISYPLQNQKAINEALSSLNPAQNDIIKSQQRFAVFDASLGWVGSLTFLQSGKGYMLYSANYGTLQISSNYAKNTALTEKAYPQFNLSSSNMTLIATLDLPNSQEYVVKAYSNNELCGFAEPILVDNTWMFFITINQETNNNIEFRAIDKNSELLANQNLIFIENETIGDLKSPLILTFKSNLNEIESFNYSIYPNPFNKKLNLDIEIQGVESIEVSVANILGEKISESSWSNLTKGKHSIDLSSLFNSVSQGVFILSIKYGEYEQIQRIIKQ